MFSHLESLVRFDKDATGNGTGNTGKDDEALKKAAEIAINGQLGNPNLDSELDEALKLLLGSDSIVVMHFDGKGKATSSTVKHIPAKKI